MAFNESTIEEVLQAAQREGAPSGALATLEAEMKEVLHAHRRRMDRINRHTNVLATLADCGFRVSLAAEKLEMTREGVYKHLRKSTETAIGVDTQAA